MAILISRKYLLVLILSSMYQRSIGQCPTSNLRNTVLKEGESLKMPQPINRTCVWKMISSDSFYNSMVKVATSGEGLLTTHVDSLMYDQSGLTILNATASPAKNKTWSSAGLYIMEDKDSKCNSSANVVVIKSGPTCQCSASTKTTPTTYDCILTYAQSPACRMNVQFTWTSVDGKNQASNTPNPKKLDKYTYQSSSTIIPMVASHVTVGNFTPSNCTVNFTAPPRSPYPSIDRVPPSYTDSCSFKPLKCNKTG